MVYTEDLKPFGEIYAGSSPATCTKLYPLGGMAYTPVSKTGPKGYGFNSRSGYQNYAGVVKWQTHNA